MADKWKVVAIIFIVLFILETVAVLFLVKIGIDEYDKDTKCAIEVCGSDEYDSYFYEYNVCNCYKDNEIVLVKVF